jgi:hypothetical protein
LDCIQEQEAKKAAIEASEKARIAAFEAAATNSASAADLAAAAAAAVAKLKKVSEDLFPYSTLQLMKIIALIDRLV